MQSMLNLKILTKIFARMKGVTSTAAGKSRNGAAMSALDKMISILEAFLPEGQELRLSQITQLTGINKSTAYVIAQALVERGYLSQSDKGGAYFLGLRFIELANVVREKLNVVDLASPHMKVLSEEVGETVELVVRDGNYGVIVATVRPERRLTAFGTGKWAARLPLYNTACGKILTAYAPPEEWRKLRANLKIIKETPKTITSMSALESHLEKVRIDGIAVDDEEAELGIRSVSAPVRDSTGAVIAAIDILGPKSRLTNSQINVLKPLVQDCGLRISKAMGYAHAQSRGARVNAG